MLQARRSPRRALTGASISAALAPAVDFVRGLAAADPGLVRLILAARGTLSVVLATLAATLVGRMIGASPVVFAAGITFSLMAPLLMREPMRAQRQRTLLVLALPAAFAAVATAVLHGHGPAGDSCFLVLVFVCFLVQPRGARMIGIGLVAIVGTYVGLFLELPPATLPLQLASIAGALPVVAFACFVALPMNAAATLRRTVAAVQWRAARVLHSARIVSDHASAPDAWLRRLRRDLARLNEAALAADDQLTLMQPDGREALRAGLIDIELAAHRMAEAVRGGPPGPRQAARIRLHARRLARGGAYALPAAALERGSLLACLVELGHATHALGLAAGAMAPASAAPPGAVLPPGKLAWRLAARVTLAAGLAMAGGMALSPQRWFWAVITVYVVFLNSRSRGDTIYKGVQRLAGTLLGIASGLALATALADQPTLRLLALLIAVFGMYYTFTVAYLAAIFCVTVLLGLLYGMLGASLETLLVLRLEETAIGAAAAMAVAAFVLPTRTRDQVRQSGRAVVAALAGAVRASRHSWGAGRSPSVDTPAPPAPMVAMRQVDRQIADLRLALAPLTARRALLRRAALEPRAAALLECVHWTRVLAACRAGEAAPSRRHAWSARAAAIEAALADLAQGGNASTMHLPTDAGDVSADGEIGAALDRLAGAVVALARRLEADVWSGFAVDG